MEKILKLIFICRCVNAPSWDDAQSMYPNFAREARLKSFLNVIKKSKQKIPQVFLDYCQAALDSKAQEPYSTVSRDGTSAHFLKANFKTISEEGLRTISTYRGSHLVIACLPQVSQNVTT